MIIGLLNETVGLKCIQGSPDQTMWQYSNCYVGGTFLFDRGDKLWLKDLYNDWEDVYIHLDPQLKTSAYWGAFRLGDA